MKNEITKYAIADRIEDGFRVMIMSHDAEDNTRLVENIYELGDLRQVSLFSDFDNVTNVARSHPGVDIIDTDCLSLAEALECVVE